MISPSPVAISADLADAALWCPAVARARKLADWIGPGRKLTSSVVLRPAAAAEACRALGIELPAARLRSALDVDELMRDWTTAVDAGFVVIDGRRARAAPGLADSPDPGVVLNAWVRAAALGAGVAGKPCAGCLLVLHELYEGDGPLPVKELADAVAATGPDVPDGEPRPDCGGVHGRADPLGIGDFLDDEDPAWPDSDEHAEDAVACLVAFGAATASGGAVQLTPLGSMLARSVFEGCAPAPDADAAALLSVISDVPPRVARTMARPWLDARPADAAVRELLALAESAAGEQRVAALAFAQELGPAAAPAWREWAGRPGFGAYARRWLADQEGPARGGPSAQDAADDAWLTVDMLSIMLDALPDTLPSLLRAEFQQQTGDMTDILSLMRDSGHPAAASVVAQLTGQPYLLPSLAGPPDLLSWLPA